MEFDKLLAESYENFKKELAQLGADEKQIEKAIKEKFIAKKLIYNVTAMVELKRALGLLDTVLLSLGATIGAGIFVVTGFASQIAGPSLIISVILAGIVAALTGVSASQLVKAFPIEGGEYEYAYRTLTPFLAFLSGWMWCLNKIVMDSVIALGFSTYASLFLPIHVKALAMLVVASATAINYIGISTTSKTINLLTIVKLSILFLFILVGILNVKMSNYSPFFPNGISGMLQAAAIIFFAYVGFIRPIYVVEEVKEPERIVPRGMFLGLLISIFVYSFVTFVAIGLVGSKGLGSTDSPLALAISSISFPFGVQLIISGAMLATYSVLIGDLLGLSRMLFAMGRKGDLPRWFGTVEKYSQNPRSAVLFSGLAIGILSLLFDLRGLVQVASFLILVYFTLLNFSATRLRGNPRRFYIISVAGMLSTLTLASSLSPLSVILGVSLILIGVTYFYGRMVLFHKRGLLNGDGWCRFCRSAKRINEIRLRKI
jgi:APA family basic amino acid/polyamine antiporter